MGLLQSLFKTTTMRNYCNCFGTVSGSEFPSNSRLTVGTKDGKTVFIVYNRGMKDFYFGKFNIKSAELIQGDSNERIGDDYYVCNKYRITLKNGTTFIMNIHKGNVNILEKMIY